MPKTKAKGRARSGRGRSSYSELNTPEKKIYHAKKVQQHRERNEGPSTSQQQQATPPQRSANPASAERGRPSILDESMSPRTRKRRSRSNTAEKQIQQERKERVSETRRQAVAQRLDRQEPEEVQPETDQNESLGVEPLAAELKIRQIYRHKAKLRALLPSNPIAKVDVFLRLLNTNPDFFMPDILPPISKEQFGSMTARQVKYKAETIRSEVYSKLAHLPSVIKDMNKMWVGEMLSDPISKALIAKLGMKIPEDYTPKTELVARVSEELSSQFLARNFTKGSNEAQRKQGVCYVLAVARKAGLNVDTYGDIQALQYGTKTSFSFAKSVLCAIRDGTENNLLKRDIRADSIKCTHWPSLIADYVLDPANSRAVPGGEDVSVRYGVRKPKFVLLHTKDEIAHNFKQANPECEFSVSTIMREFPQNAVTATTRDSERNTCPYHANARRLVKCINGALAVADVKLEKSCREMAAYVMCKHEDVDTSDPSTWKEECATGVCKNCPSYEVQIPDALKNVMVTYSQWTTDTKIQKQTKKPSKKSKVKGDSKLKEKKVFGLFPFTEKLSDVAQKFSKSLIKLKHHIFTAKAQWNAHTHFRSTMDDNSVITIEDYQQNLEVTYIEAPTSMAYSSNKLTVAIYPICVEYLVDRELCKGAIVFISDDKVHDLQQVAAFEKRAFEIIREELPFKQIDYWQRWADACAAQFRSRYCNGKLKSACKDLVLKRASFCYFEAHEGKNISDTIGSIVKCAFIRRMNKFDQGISTAHDVVKLVIEQQNRKKMEKFDFFIVEEFGEIERIPDNERSEVPVPNIMR